jgi:hypothetical protein
MAEDAKVIEALRAGNDLADTVVDIYRWMDMCVPNWEHLEPTGAKIGEEMREWLDSEENEELADVFIATVFGLRLRGIDFAELVKAKMAVNWERTWVWDEERGVYHHA